MDHQDFLKAGGGDPGGLRDRGSGHDRPIMEGAVTMDTTASGRTILVSMGDAVFAAPTLGDDAKARDWRARLAGAPPDGLPPDILAAIAGRLLGHDAGYGFGAELDTLLALPQPLQRDDDVFLLVPEVVADLAAARVVHQVLEARHGVDCAVVPIAGLRPHDRLAMEEEGLPNMVREAGRLLEKSPRERRIVVASGGYRAFSAYLAVVGMVFGAEVLYHQPGGGPPLSLPPTGLQPDTELWRRYRSWFVAAEFDGGLPTTSHPLPEDLFAYMHASRGHWRLTAMGELLERAAEARYADPLTGAWRRGLFDEDISRLTGLHDRLGLVLFDIDRFKSVNDTHGHAAGDRVLAEFVSRCRPHVLRAGGEIIRYGGEEFLALLPDADLDTALAVAEDMRRDAAARPIALREADLPVTATFGVAVWQSDGGISVDQAIALADEYLYRGKRGGRNRVCGPEAVAVP